MSDLALHLLVHNLVDSTIKPASRSDVLEWLEWEEASFHKETEGCCVDGLVPPAHQVEAVKNAIARTFIEEMGWGESKPWEALEVYAMAEIQARATLIAAMKAVSDD